MKNTARIFLTVLLIAAVTGGLFAGGRTSGTGRLTPITFLLLGNKPTNGRADAAVAEINKIVGPRIGVELRTEYVEWADWQNQYQLRMASGDPNLDLIVTATDWLYAWEIARKGGFYALTPELLQANAPQTWAEIPQSHWDLCTEDGKIWFIPEDQYSQYTNHGMYWRKDWAAEGGLTNVATFEDLEKYWDIVKKNHPEAYPWDINGAEYRDMGLITGYIQGKHSVQTIIGAATGNYSIFQYNTSDPYTVVSYYMDGNDMVDAAVMFDRFAKKGFWREDVLNYRGETRNLLLAGLSGSDQHHTQTYIGLREQMDKEQPGSELQMYWWGMENNNINKDLLTHGACAINGASRNVEKALQLYDLMRNDKQIYLLYNYGIEGKDYIVRSDGRFSRPEGFNSTNDALDTNFWAGRVDKFEPVWDTWWTGRTAFVEYLNSFAKEYPLGKFSFDNTKVAAEMAAVGDVCATYIPSIHFGKTSNPEKAVSDFRAALRAAGYDKVKAEIQAQLTASRNAR
ncbi:MAG: ABC transporter substrate-binding protein [Treponema sp.]|jgi:ABC-type glycerol-3-phosphate transport system substrate-binding protein|nr:ABC transporter substrate-binding protein [Treponema sp.]